MRKLILFVFLILSAFAIFCACDSSVKVEKKQYALKYYATEGGFIDGESEQMVEEGGCGVLISATANSGYVFKIWSDGFPLPERIDTNVIENKFLTAIFAESEFKINYLAGNGGIIEGNQTQTVLYGKNATAIIAKPNEGYEFAGWSDTKSTSPLRADNNVTTDLNAIALFQKVSITINYSAAEGGFIYGENNQQLLFGENASAVTAIANNGYRFVVWSDNYPLADRLDTNLSVDTIVTAIFKKIEIKVIYLAGIGGIIEGNQNQTVLFGESSGLVIAKANEGHRFIGWDDEYGYAERIDNEVTETISVTALFEKIVRVYTYVYNSATENNTEINITLRYESLFKAKFAIPARINSVFNGWYLEKDFKTQVTDEIGNIIIGHEIFENESDCLYAKWTTINKYTYDILLTFVTEVDADLIDYHGKNVKVNYSMSNTERQICELIPIYFEKALNDIFAGLVVFNVDSYFTTEPIDENCFRRFSNLGFLDYDIDAKKIPEINNGLADNYRSVIATYGMNDYNSILHGTGGGAYRKYASIHIESFLRGFLVNDLPFDIIIDYPDIWVPGLLSHYFHEFTHTVEVGLKVYPFHDTGVYYANVLGIFDEFDVVKLYLINQAVVDGIKVGIPYIYWQDEIYVTLTYIAGTGGSISGNSVQTIKLSRDAESVTAIPDFGYRFVSWNNNYPDTPERTDRDVEYNSTHTAIFEEITRPFLYYYDLGITEIELLTYKDLFNTTLWIPQKEGYLFGGWYSDAKFTQKFADEHGNILNLTYDIFDYTGPITVIYAYWIPI